MCCLREPINDQLPELLVHMRLFNPFVFRSSVLEPNFYLALREIQHLGQLEPARSGYVVCTVVF